MYGEKVVNPQNELTLFLKEYVHKDENVLNWWKRNETKYPNLAMLARKYLSIPAATSAIERDFSYCGHIMTAERTSLKEDIFNSLCFLKDYFKMKNINNYNALMAEQKMLQRDIEINLINQNGIDIEGENDYFGDGRGGFGDGRGRRNSFGDSDDNRRRSIFGNGRGGFGDGTGGRISFQDSDGNRGSGFDGSYLYGQ